MNSLFETLEFDQIKARLAGHCVSQFGRERADDIRLFSAPAPLKTALDQTTELRDLSDYDQPPPIENVADLRTMLKKVRLQGSLLRIDEFVELLKFLQVIRNLHGYFRSRRERIPQLSKITSELVSIESLEKQIRACIDSDTQEVKSSAGPTLSSIRKNIERTKAAARHKMESKLKSLAAQGVLQENIISVRNDRLVLVIKEEFKRKIKGLVHDRSATGASLFIEPLDVVDDNNRVRELVAEEAREIERILIQLTDEVREHQTEINRDCAVFAEIDFVNAKALLSRSLKAFQPHITEEPVVDLAGARHPLLLLRMGENRAVPMDICLGAETHTFIISGPNAGGKTVALKTVGLLTLMGLCGLHIPAQPHSRLGLLKNIFANIGDQQSLENDLSTFSSHLAGLKDVAERADNATLVLVDEIGSGTDPEEGMALAVSLLEQLTRRRVLTIVTTHQSPLKAFAYETEGAENASLEFDLATLQPTYRFRAGIPGSSYAFEIAQRMGLSDELIQRARELVGAQKGALEGLILELEEKVQHFKKLSAEANVKETEYRGLLKLYKERYQKLRAETNAIRRQAVQEAEALLKESNAAVEGAVRHIRESGADKEVVKQSRQVVESQKKKVAKLKKQTAIESPPKQTEPISKGDYVRWSENGATGYVISMPDKKGRVMVQYDSGMKMQTPASTLEKAKKKKARASVRFTAEQEKSYKNEIDLRGMMSEEALDALEQFLDEAMLAGFHSISIVHGKGTGALRKAVARYLAGHPQVQSFRLGYWNEGDSGVTVADLVGHEKEHDAIDE